MRDAAANGRPLILLEGHGGNVLGQFVILAIDETKSELMGDGAAQLIKFSIKLKEYGGDRGSFGKFGTALSVLSTLARLV